MKYLIEVPDETGQAYYNIAPYVCEDNAMWMDGYEKGVEAGRDDAWEFVKALYGLSDEELYEIFPNGCPYEMIYSEAKVKYEAWEKSKEEIHVGDEVTDNDLDEIGVVTYVYDSYCFILWSDGSVSEEVRKSELRSTGRHFNITHELLKKMRDAE